MLYKGFEILKEHPYLFFVDKEDSLESSTEPLRVFLCEFKLSFPKLHTPLCILI